MGEIRRDGTIERNCGMRKQSDGKTSQMKLCREGESEKYRKQTGERTEGWIKNKKGC